MFTLRKCSSYHMFFWSSFFWQLWQVGCAGCTVFGCLWQTSLCWNFGQQFFRGPRYVVNAYCLLSDELQKNIRYLSRNIGLNCSRYFFPFHSNNEIQIRIISGRINHKTQVLCQKRLNYILIAFNIATLCAWAQWSKNRATF